MFSEPRSVQQPAGDEDKAQSVAVAFGAFGIKCGELNPARRPAQIAEEVGDDGSDIDRASLADARFGEEIGRALGETAGERFEGRAFVVHVFRQRMNEAN